MIRTAALLVALASPIASGATTAPTTTAPTSTAPTTTTASPASTQSSALPAPTRVTLKLDRVKAATALKRLLDQGGVVCDDFNRPFIVNNLNDATVTMDVADEPFNLALLEMCRQAWLEPRAAQGPQRGIGFVIRHPRGSPTTQPSWVDAPPISSGPFVLVPQGTSRTSQIDLDGPPAPPARTMTLTLMALADPRLRVFAIGDTLTVDDARDEAGRSLVVFAPPAAGSAPPPRVILNQAPWMWSVTVPLAYPTDESRKLVSLRGRLNATVVTRSESIDLVNGDGAITGDRTVGGMQFSVTKLQEAGPGSQMNIRLHRGTADDRTWQEMRAMIRHDTIRASDPAGGGYYRLQVIMHAEIENRIYEGFIRYTPCRPNGADGDAKWRFPAKVVWDAPVEVQDVTIPVELRDLPLP